MSSKPFPNNPAQRKVVVVLEEPDFDQFSYDPEGAKLLTASETHLVTFPVETDVGSPSALRNIVRADLARPGKMLIQSPFDPDVYEDAEEAPTRFALAKHMAFARLCHLLGAKEVKVEQIELQSSRGTTTVEVKGGKPTVTGEVRVDREVFDKFQRSMQLDDTYAGSDPDVAAAESYLLEKNLDRDPEMQSLVDLRRPGKNMLKSRTFRINLSSEGSTSLNVAAKLKVPAYVTLSANYKSTLETRAEFTLTVTVSF